MALIQRAYPTYKNLVYSSGLYENPNWIVSLSPAKVGSGVPQWNAARILGYPIYTDGAASGQALVFTGSGFKVLPVSGGTGSGTVFTASSGIILDSDVLKMGGTGQLTLLNFQSDPFSGFYSGIILKDLADGFINLENVVIGSTEVVNQSLYNVAIGRYSFFGTSGERNIAIGSNPLSYTNANDSIAFGVDSSSYCVNYFNSNVAFGNYSLTASTSVTTCIAIGESALNSCNGFSHSIGIGYFAGSLATNAQYSVFIGDAAGSYSSGNNNLFIGTNAGSYCLGSGNLEIISASIPLVSGAKSNKLNINGVITGDFALKRIAVGNLNSSLLSPLGTLHVVPTSSGVSNGAIFIDSTSGFTSDFLACATDGYALYRIDSSGVSSGNFIRTNSGIYISSNVPVSTSQSLYASGNDLCWSNNRVLLSPTIIGSTGMVLNDSHNGTIVEHTGVVSGIYTLGSISIPSWQCMLVNYASGLSVASGSNVVRSRNNLTNVSVLHSYASVYRRSNGEFFIYGELN